MLNRIDGLIGNVEIDFIENLTVINLGELPKAEDLGLPGMTCGGPLALHPVGYAP